jgi:hypothetical protein
MCIIARSCKLVNCDISRLLKDVIGTLINWHGAKNLSGRHCTKTASPPAAVLNNARAQHSNPGTTCIHSTQQSLAQAATDHPAGNAPTVPTKAATSLHTTLMTYHSQMKGLQKHIYNQLQ